VVVAASSVYSGYSKKPSDFEIALGMAGDAAFGAISIHASTARGFSGAV